VACATARRRGESDLLLEGRFEAGESIVEDDGKPTQFVLVPGVSIAP
jgi:hypothetical protein